MHHLSDQTPTIRELVEKSDLGFFIQKTNFQYILTLKHSIKIIRIS
jgi:hypothetical protein